MALTKEKLIELIGDADADILDALRPALAGTIRLDGDSFGTTGTAGKLFIDRVVAERGYTLTNESVGGSETLDVWEKIVDEITMPSAYRTHMLNVGFNDMRKWGSTAGQDAEIAGRIVAIVKYLQLQSVYFYTNAGATYSGAWGVNASIPESVLGSAKYTAQEGAYVSFSFTGTKLSIGTFTLKAAGTNAEVLVEIDGTEYDTYLLDAWTGFNAYGQHVVELAGLSSGTHTCKITKIDATANNMYFDWWGIKSDAPPKVIVNGITRMKTESYTLYAPFNAGNDAAVEADNKAIRAALAENFDGSVTFIDQSNFDPNTYTLISSDEIHPSDYGHAWIADNILRYGADMNIPPTVNPLATLYENSWVDFDTGYEWQRGGYEKSQDGMVRLCGLIAGGTVTADTVLFTLPAGYRPVKREMFGCICDTGVATLTVKADGTVTAFTGVSNSYLSLSGISFKSA